MGYNKKVLSKATSELGKAKAPPKPRDIIMDPRGQWAYPGQPTRIPGNNITMQGVPYPVYGIDNTGFAQMMYPGQDYQFQGDYVDEYPLTQAKKGGQKKYSRSLTATNKLFTKNELFKKKKKKKKIFDPNARYYQDGGDISIAKLTEAQVGIQTSCPDGQVWDDKLQECVKPGIQEVEEAVVYGNEEKRKLQGNLMDKLKQVKGAYQDWREDAGLRRTRLRNEGASSIEGLKREIAEYKKQLDEEKKAYSKAQSALKVLQNKWPEDDWFNAKLSDVLTPKGIEDLRALYAKGDISKETFMDFYESFGKDYDVNVIEGRGPNRAYSAKEAEQDWMYDATGFADKVNKFVRGLVGVAAGGASLSAMGGVGGAARLASRVLGNKLVQGAVAADSIYTLGTESLPKLDRALESGENIGDAVFDVGVDAIDLIFAKGVIGDAAKFVNKGLVRADKYVAPIRNVLTTPIREMPYIEKAFGLQNNLFLPQNKSAFKEALENLTPGQLMTGSAIAATTLGLPEYAQEAEQTYERLVDPNIAWRDKYSNLKSFGNRTGQLLLDYTPLSQRLKPLGETRASILYQMPEDFSKWEQGNWGSGYSSVKNILTLIEPRMGNLPNRQKGGSSNSYVTSLSKKEIKELERQGYKIEYLD